MPFWLGSERHERLKTVSCHADVWSSEAALTNGTRSYA